MGVFSEKDQYGEIKKVKVSNIFKLIVLPIVILILLMALNPFVVVGAGHRGVVLNWGAVSGKVMEEGLHFRTPFMQKVVKIDVQTQKLEENTDAYSKDIQSVKTTLALNYHVNPSLVNNLYQNVGDRYVERLVIPAIQESVKSAIAQFTAQNLVEERPKVKEEIKMELSKRLSAYLSIDEFSVTNFTFSEQYEKAVEEKQEAQQKALKAENDLNRIKTEAEQRIAQAKAEAEAIRIQASAINSQGGADYVKIQAIQKWDGKLPAQMIPGGTVPFLDLNK
jgi:regulator of protease activity HflC (stomatin/prohibitin superfamily)